MSDEDLAILVHVLKQEYPITFEEGLCVVNYLARQRQGMSEEKIIIHSGEICRTAIAYKLTVFEVVREIRENLNNR